MSLKDEKAYVQLLFPIISPVFISFGFVDCITCGFQDWYIFFAVRIAAVLIARLGFLLARGRTKYSLRIFLAVCPYVYSVEFLMIWKSLLLTPYFSGLGLIMLCATILFPTRAQFAFFLNAAYILPLVIWVLFHPFPDLVTTATLLLMTGGSALLAILNSREVNDETKRSLKASEALARDLGKREREVQEKVAELFKRQIFESQFSPQVVSAILADRSLIKKMVRKKVANIVIDIEESTKKANALDPEDYKQVIEEVLDVFSASCLKWNITLDKFIGDGVQAFAGAPFSTGDELHRAVMACKDCQSMLHGRRAALDALWKGQLNVRFAVCHGEALVGFVGRGIFKSYTAIGDMISFTHRLAAVPDPWTIAAYRWDPSSGGIISAPGYSTSSRTVTSLKGFGSKAFEISVLTPQSDDAWADAGRCPVCETSLVLGEGAGGLPKVFCPACVAKDGHLAAA